MMAIQIYPNKSSPPIPLHQKLWLTFFTYRFSCLNVDSEKGVTSRRRIVHGCLAHFTKPVTLVHDSIDLTNALHCDDCQVLDEHSFLLVLLQVKLLVRILAQQISDLFIVDFHVRASYQELFLDISRVINASIYVLEGIGNDSLVLLGLQADHSMRLATTCLSIGEDSSIVATNDRLD